MPIFDKNVLPALWLESGNVSMPVLLAVLPKQTATPAKLARKKV